MKTLTRCMRSFSIAIGISLLIVGVVGISYAGGKDSRLLRVKVTAYCAGPCSICGTTGITKIGRDANTNGCAVDPDTIPLHSRLDIPGYGSWIKADDTGGLVRGAHVDVRFTDHATARKWGTKWLKIRVWD